jgi:hypothetical protein
VVVGEDSFDCGDGFAMRHRRCPKGSAPVGCDGLDHGKSITMDVGETTPQQTFAQINVLIAPAPIAIREPVSRRELLLLDEDDAAEKNVDQPFR